MTDSYDASLPTKLDEIRFLVFDTKVPFLVPNATINAELGKHEDWRSAAADIAENVANQLERRMTGFGEAGGASQQWGDRAKTLRLQAQRWRAEVAADTAAVVRDAENGMTAVSLVRGDAVASVEYSRTRRKRGF